MSLLKKIQTYVQQYAEVIANILGCEVEIADENLMRIAGTGIFNEKINEKCEGSIYPDVFITQKSHIITNPKENELCFDCKIRNICDEELEVSSPIFYKKRVIGVIGLICFSKNSKERILKNMDIYLKFTEQISDFISSKVFEIEERIKIKEQINIFSSIINFFRRGILILDEDTNIVLANTFAENELKIYHEKGIGYPKINLIEKKELLNGEKIFLVEVNKNIFEVLGNYQHLFADENCEYSIFIFEKKPTKINKLEKEIERKSKNINMDDFIGESDKMLEVKKIISKVAQTNSTVLITGETGTGKELVARLLHSLSIRNKYPFIPINCGAIPENLLESELFGYVKGAFSGANQEGKIGKFELANKGVVFLDEISEMPLSLQVKLLRVLQEKEIEKIGSNKTIKLDIRIIAASNANLLELVEKNKFREDLYYRLNVINIETPSLRERRSDIPVLLNHFCENYAERFETNTPKITKEIKNILMTYNWPGNVRELENIVEYLFNMKEENGEISLEIVEELNKKLQSRKGRNSRFEISTLEEMEKKLITDALKIYGNSHQGKQECANVLGIGIATLYRKIEKYGLV